MISDHWYYMTKKKESKVLPSKVMTWVDLRSIFYRGRKALFFSFFTGSIMGLFMLSTMPVSYQAKATFQEAKETSFSKEQMLQDLLIAKSLETSQESKTIALMQSIRVLRPLIHEMGMQAEVKKEDLFSSILDRLKEHWQAQIGRLSLGSRDFIFEKINYPRETPFSCTLIFEDPHHFYLSHEKDKLYQVGSPVFFSDFSWTLKTVPQNLEVGKPYRVTFTPWQEVYQKLTTRLKIKPLKISGKEHKSLYQLFFSAKDRFFAADLLNGLIFSYKKVVQEDADRFVQDQLSYLKTKEQEMQVHLASLFSDYTSYLQSLLMNEGVGGSHQQVELLTKAYQENVEKIAKIDLELQKEPFLGMKELPFSLEIEKKRIALEKLEKQEKLLESSFDLMASRDFFPDMMKSYDRSKENLDLDTILSFSKEVTLLLEKSERKIETIERLLEVDDFSLFSLAMPLQDGFIQKICEKSFPLCLLLKDLDHCSEKEKMRWEEDLSLQKKILLEHLEKLKIAELIEKKKLEERKAFLENKRLFLIQKEMADLKKDVEEMEKMQRKFLQDEKLYAEMKIEEIQKAFDLFPQRWRKEKWLEIQTHLETKWIQSIQEMIESKTIGHQLHSLESKELDLAALPLKPKALFSLFLLGGAFLFLCFAAAKLFFSSFFQGFPASYDQLRSLGFLVLGKTSFFKELIPKIALFSKEKVVTLFVQDGQDYSFSLQKFLEERGKDVLFLRPSLKDLASTEWSQFLERKKKEKGQLFVVVSAFIQNPEALFGLEISTQSVVLVGKESVEELYSFIEWADEKHQIGWVVADGIEQ